MAKPKRDKKREERIENEIIVDCYDSYERWGGWCAYLEDQMQFPSTATCIAVRDISPLKVKEKVEVIDLANDDETKGGMFVKVRWNDRTFAVPLSQLKPSSKVDAETKVAIADWHYWASMGYEF